MINSFAYPTINNAVYRVVNAYPSFITYNEDVEQIEWLDETVEKPSNESILAAFQELVDEFPMHELRDKRDQLLADTDWVVSRAVDASNDGLGIQLPQVWVDYRQALRDLPANTTDPANPVWPTKP